MTPAARGRPRSESVRRAILESARDILAEAGYEQLTISAIADRSGSGRQTIYRWWSSKALIVADLVLEGDLVLAAQAVPDTGSLAADLTEWLTELTVTTDAPGTAGIMRALITAASVDEEEARLLYSMSTAPYHDGLVARLTEGKRVGQLRESVNETAVADALIGTVIYRALTPGATPAPPGAIIHALIAS